MVTDVVGDNAVGLSTLSQTNTVAVYEPEALGVHDNAGLIDCPAVKDPVIHANDTVTPFSSCTCTK
jgi:hypothetical protein